MIYNNIEDLKNYAKSGERAKYLIELDVNDGWWEEEPDEADKWWKETLKNADTVDVLLCGPAGGNPMFVLTSNDRSVLLQALKRYNNENGPDLENYYGPLDEELSEWIFENNRPDYWSMFN